MAKIVLSKQKFEAHCPYCDATLKLVVVGDVLTLSNPYEETQPIDVKAEKQKKK